MRDSRTRIWAAPLVAAAIAAANPYYIIMSVLILSEAVFVPLMLAALWGLALLWVEPGRPDGMGVRGHGRVSRPEWQRAWRSWSGRHGHFMCRSSSSSGSLHDCMSEARGSRPFGVRCRRGGSGGGDEPVVGSEHGDLWALCADGAVDGGEPLRWAQSNATGASDMSFLYDRESGRSMNRIRTPS